MKRGRRWTMACVLAGLMVLSVGCSGGKGGGGSMAPMSGPVVNPTTPTQTNYERLARTNTAAQPGSARAAANALPEFGSIVQSSNRDASGTTTDTVRVTFEGDNMRAVLTRQDGSTLAMDTATDAIESNPASRSFVEGISAKDWTLIDLNDRYIAVVGRAWATASPSLWAGYGYWLHLPSGGGAEMGSFIDGLDLRPSDRPTMPASMNATYRAAAEGGYVREYGTSAPRVPGSTEVGQWTGDLVLNATIGGGTSRVSGSIGNIQSTRAVGATPSGIGFVGGLTPYPGLRLDLGSASITPQGTFRANSVRWTDSDPAYRITSSSGSWGGMFSKTVDSSGVPVAAGGTVGGSVSYATGDSVSYIGAWGGLRTQ